MDEEKCMSLRLNCISNVKAAVAKYDECYKDGWEFTFVGCCRHDQHDFCTKCKTNPARLCCTTSKCKQSNIRVISAKNNGQDDDGVTAKEGIFSSQHESQTADAV